MRALYQRFSEALKRICEVKYSVDIVPPLWEIPRQKQFGDFSTMIALKIASKLKCEPLKVAIDIKKILNEELSDEVERIEVIQPGFVNIFVSTRGLIQSFNRILEKKSNFFKEKRKRRVLLEFVSANPTGPLSIAHGRQAVVGDVIGRILEFFGNEVTREYYINDEGRQIDLLILSIKEMIKKIKGEGFKFPQDGYRGVYITKVAQKAMKTKEKNLKDFAISCLLALIKNDLASLNIEFDSWFSQRALIKKKFVDKTVELLKSKGLACKRDQALWFISSRFGDDKDRVLKKKNGQLTYFASDIAYHKNKVRRGFDKLINLWGPDHHGYIKRMNAAIKALGYNNDILDIIIIQLVSLKSKERMSRRRGTAILLSELIEEVGADAARFYYLLRRNGVS